MGAPANIARPAGGRYLALAFAAALALAGCASEPPARPSHAAGFVTGTSTIEVRTVDRLALRAASLVLADGGRIWAREIASTQPPERRPPARDDLGVGVGAAGGSSSGVATGVFIELPVNLDFRRKKGASDLIESRARIDVSDLALYARSWATAHLELTLGDPPETRHLELPAPMPER